MELGGITAHHRTQLEVINGNLTGIQYRYEVLYPHVLPFLQVHGCHITLQQDNAQPHIARVVTDFIAHFPGQIFRLMFLPESMCGMKYNYDYAVFKTSRRRWPNCGRPWCRSGMTSLKPSSTILCLQ